MKYLIVDDQVENRMILSKILAPYAQCDTATNGAEAVELFKNKLITGSGYDLVILDIMMPIMDGQEALMRIREIERETGTLATGKSAVIMVTAVDATSEMKKAFEEGQCTDYINKPISRGKVLVKLSEHGLIPSNWWQN